MLATARVTSLPPSRAPPSRRSAASRDPRDAPAGAIERPTAPVTSRTSASTVGRPRESHTRRPWTETISLLTSGAFRLSPTHADIGQSRLRTQEKRACKCADAVLCPGLGDVLHGRLAVDACQHQRRE